jgi:hypothetical protein
MHENINPSKQTKDDEEYVTILPAQVMDDFGKGLTKLK